MLVIALAAACVAAGTATGDPSIAAKQAQAQQVLSRLQQLDASVQRATSAYDAASAGLYRIERSLKINRQALHVARSNLGKAQVALEQRLVVIYTTRDEQSTLSVLLGAQSIDDLVNRIETVQSVSSQDVAVMNQVISFKRQIATHERILEHARAEQTRLVRQRAAAKAQMISERDHEQTPLQLDQGRDREPRRPAARTPAPARERRAATARRAEPARALGRPGLRGERIDAGRHQRRSAVAVHGGRRDRPAVSRHAVRLGRLQPRRLRLLRLRRVRLRAGRGLASALHRRTVERRRPGLPLRSPAGRSRLLRRARPRRHLHRRRPVRPRAAHRATSSRSPASARRGTPPPTTARGGSRGNQGSPVRPSFGARGDPKCGLRRERGPGSARWERFPLRAVSARCLPRATRGAEASRAASSASG